MRYTGPKWRINRKENANVLGSTDKWRRRPGLPGQHPFSKSRPSEYAFQFREKQKVKRMYGMTEAQFRKFYNLALKSPGNSGTRLLQLLELRVDNVLYSLGFALTRAQARQFVTHGHILLNGKKHNIPSTVLGPNDEIRFNEKHKDGSILKEVLHKNRAKKIPAWLEKLENGGKIVSEPTRDQIDPSIKERLIIELYSR